jgi:hypothetical protein
MRACSGHCGVSGEHRRDAHPCPGRPARHATWLVTGLPLFVLQVGEDRDHGGRRRCRDTPRRPYPLTPETDARSDPCRLHPPAPDRFLTPGEALAKLFLDNAERGADVTNDELGLALRQRAREIGTDSGIGYQ